MRNIPIEGGEDVGPPEGWDEALSGECLTISVLRTTDNGLPFVTTAWQMTDIELAAMNAGGHVFFGVNANAVPVQRIFVQGPDGTLAGDLMVDRGPTPLQYAAGQRKALVAICESLAHKRGHWKPGWDANLLTTAELIRELAAMVDGITHRDMGHRFYNGSLVSGAMVELPVHQLSEVPFMKPLLVPDIVAARRIEPAAGRLPTDRPAQGAAPSHDDLPAPGGQRILQSGEAEPDADADADAEHDEALARAVASRKVLAATIGAKLTDSHRFVMRSVSGTDNGGLYGECKGPDLDALMESGLVRIIPTNQGGDWNRVILTALGWAAL